MLTIERPIRVVIVVAMKRPIVQTRPTLSGGHNDIRNIVALTNQLSKSDLQTSTEGHPNVLKFKDYLNGNGAYCLLRLDNLKSEKRKEA
jgi:hypothetical protein